jgi:outer membrane protein assembly factor BamB
MGITRRGGGVAVSLGIILFSSITYAADWPMYRCNPGRTGYTHASLPTELAPRWSFRLPGGLQPAWPENHRLLDDRAAQMVVADGTVFFGGSVDGKVYALDEATGRLKWTRTTDMPIRFAPAVWKDRLFAASDDGNLYALSTRNGELLWKRRGGPDDRSILGNERIISRWPARGGPVVADDRVYFAAGMWPSEGIYLYALNPADGNVLWVNDNSGEMWMPQPHRGAMANSGVSAQGYLVTEGDRLLMPTGRAVPACFDRTNGTFQYFHLQGYGKSGGSAIMAVGANFFNGGIAYSLVDGKKAFSVLGGVLAAAPDTLVQATGRRRAVPANSIVACTLKSVDVPDRRGVARPKVSTEQRWSNEIGFSCASLIVAGNQVIAGGEGSVAVLDLETGETDWTTDLPGTVYGLAATDRGLLVSTDEGVIHCFGQGLPATDATVKDTPAQSPYPEKSPAALAAEEIVGQSGITRGYCVDLGCGDGELAYHLARRTDLFIYAVDDDPACVKLARAKLTQAGLYGTRVMVHRRDLAKTGYPDYFANLVVSGQSVSKGAVGFSSPEAERLQRPCGGVICMGKPGSLTKKVRGPLPGAGSWTHQYGDAANTVCSNDQLVRGRLGMLWFRDVAFDVANRHGRAPAPLCHRGRLIHPGLNGVIALDAYNGHELWRYSIPGLLTAYNGDELMGTAGTGSNLCMADGAVYVRHASRCFRLDAATGELLSEYSVPDDSDGKPGVWGYIACENGVLYGSVANQAHVVTYRYINRGGDMNRLLTESRSLFAVDAKTGNPLWSYQANDSLRHNAIALADGKVFVIDRPLALFDREKRPKAKAHAAGILLALDAKTGRVLWKQDKEIAGTTLAVGKKHNVLLMAYQPSYFQLDSERGGRLTAFNTETGQRLWSAAASYKSRLLIIDRTVYAEGGAWDLLTGEPVAFKFRRYYGCGVLSSGAHMLLFRSGTLGYYDLSGKRETENYGGIRPGCWINTIAADGLVLAPDATAGCTCSYLTRAWFALQPMRPPGEALTP